MSKHNKNQTISIAQANNRVQDDVSSAYQLFQQGDFPSAKKLCKKILQTNPAHPDANHCIALIQQRLGKHKKAIIQLEKTLASAPEHIPALCSLADSLTQTRQNEKANLIIDRALNLRPEQAVPNRTLGMLAYQTGRLEQAEHFYQRALSITPNDPHSHAGLGDVLRRMSRHEEALACYKRALELQPENASIHINRGNVLSDMGKISEAAESYQQAIRLHPGYVRAYQLLTSVRKYTACDDELKAMEALYNKPGLSIEDRMNLAFSLGKAFEDLKQYSKAFKFFQQANKQKRHLSPYSIQEDVELFSKIKSIFNTDFIEQHKNAGSTDDTPVFILGMPRSGTSLVEQILASHPDIHGAGELIYMESACQKLIEETPNKILQLKPDDWKTLANNYLEKLRTHSNSAPHITDKLPHNFLYIGMIATMLPNAKIIHCQRNPMDTCFSLFKNLFATSNLQWCYNLKDLGRYYQLYLELMEYWNDLLPGKVYNLQYEDLVTDSEQQIRQLLAFCDIPFDPACLSFYESKRSVQTLSFAQVRKPIYNSSVQLWKNYETQLQPLISLLSTGDKKTS